MERNIWRVVARTAAGALLLMCISFPPCLAQYTAGHTAAGINCIYDKHGNIHLAGATNGALPEEYAPCLQGATMGTIGPQGDDATYVTGVSTAGTVRVNMLAMLEALLNVVANGAQIITVLWGAVLLSATMLVMLKEQKGIKRFLVSTGVGLSFIIDGFGIVTNLLNCFAFAFEPPWKRKDNLRLKFWLSLFIIKIGFSIPFIINWLIPFAVDANNFS